MCNKHAMAATRYLSKSRDLILEKCREEKSETLIESSKLLSLTHHFTAAASHSQSWSVAADGQLRHDHEQVSDAASENCIGHPRVESKRLESTNKSHLSTPCSS